MADVDNPKTHIEDQEDVTLPRTQPESPHHEGIDPLTESDTMYPAHDTKGESEKLARRDASSEGVTAEETAVGDPEAQRDVVTESRDNLAEADKATDAEPANADGKLPKDSKTANHKSSDKQNTSPSNKPATKDAPKTGRSTDKRA